MKEYKIGILLMVLLAFPVLLPAQNQAPSGDKILYHTLLFNWSDSIDPVLKEEVIALFKGMPEKIDGFIGLEIYPLVKSPDNFDEVYILRFSSQEAHDTYQEHPDHKRIQTIAPPLISGFSEFDYWK